MPKFAYKAKRPNGEILEGVLEAENRRLVVSKLQGMKVFPVSIEEESGRGLQQEVSFQSFARVRFADIVTFTRQLSDLTKAGLPLVRALDVLIEQTTNEKMKSMIRAMMNDVAGGTSFSDALAKFPKQFSDLYCSMIHSGEIGGYLDTVLDRLAEFLEKEADLHSRIRNAMAYPAIMIVVACGVVLILTTYVVPTFVSMFMDQGLQLPTITKVLVGISDFVSGYWWLEIGGICLAVYAYRQFVAKPEGRVMIDRMKLKIPIFGDMIRKQEISKFARTLGTLLGNGVSILKALDVVNQVISNKILANEVAGLKGDIAEGERLSHRGEHGRGGRGDGRTGTDSSPRGGDLRNRNRPRAQDDGDVDRTALDRGDGGCGGIHCPGDDPPDLPTVHHGRLIRAENPSPSMGEVRWG
jgi:type II secretory pathway component PulF